jgi:hypothetical protein
MIGRSPLGAAYRNRTNAGLFKPHASEKKKANVHQEVGLADAVRALAGTYEIDHDAKWHAALLNSY